MRRFDHFILLAEMRTGSNFLESNLNTIAGITCHGEAFNPSFVGYPRQDDLLGFDLAARETDPHGLLTRIRESNDLPGFRYFHDHDPRILDDCLGDARCAKIVLWRNPVDSFVSWKIAQTTGQWKLTNATHAKSEPITFDTAAFAAHLEAVQAFQHRVQRALQVSGQTAFYIGYDDLRDLDVLNGLLGFLGVEGRLSSLNKKLKKQNPAPLQDKVRNFEEMQDALRGFDRFDLGRTPQFEPQRGPAVPTYIAAPDSGLIYLPLRSGPDAAIARWLASVDRKDVDAVLREFSQRSLRDWLDSHARFRSFTVLRHPLARAHAAFCDRILSDGPQSFPEIRANLRKIHKLPLPEQTEDLLSPDLDPDAHRAAFLGFLQFLKNNIAGQTSIRVDPSWAGQLTLLQGIAQFMIPDMVIREESMPRDLAVLAGQLGLDPPPPMASAHPHAGVLERIHDTTLEAAARAAYPRDYFAFGFADWTAA